MGKSPHRFMPDGKVVPEGGTRAFLRSIGTHNVIKRLLEDMNVRNVTVRSVSMWACKNEMPREIYNALNALIKTEVETTASGDETSAVDVYLDNVFAGRFELPKGVTVRLIKKRRV